MDQWKKCTRLGILSLLVMMFLATGLSAEGDTVVSGDEKPAGAASTEQPLPEKAEPPTQAGTPAVQEVPAAEPSQAPVNQTPTEAGAESGETKPPVQPKPEAVEPQMDSQPAATTQTAEPPDNPSETQAVGPPLPVIETVDDDGWHAVRP